MNRLSAISTAALLLLALCMSKQAHSRASGIAAENPWAPEHVTGLPPNIRRDVEGHAKACGNPAAGTHHFSLLIEASGMRFRSLHFEDFACARRSAVCRPNGCLHEVFANDGRRQRQVFRIYARDIRLTNEAGVGGIEVYDDGGIRSFVWDGRGFVAKRTRKER